MKKKLLILSAFAVAACSAAVLAACAPGGEDPELQSIKLSLTGVQTLYTAGDEFSSESLKVTAVYSNDEQTDVTAQVTFSGNDTDTAGVKTVTVTYGGKTAEYQIAVVPDVAENMSVQFSDADENASLTLYITAANEGKYLLSDASGYTMFDFAFEEGEFATEGLDEAVNADVWSEEYYDLAVDIDGAAQKRFTLGALEWQQLLGEDPVNEITGLNFGDKTFRAGEAFNAEGTELSYTRAGGAEEQTLTVSAADIAEGRVKFFEQGSRKDMTAADYVLPAEGISVMVVFGGVAKGDFALVPEEAPFVPVATGIELNTEGVKTLYTAGEAFESANLTVYEVYSDNTRKDVTAEVSFSDNDTYTAGVKSVKVTYGSFNASYDIAVVPAVAEDMKISFASADENASLTLYITERQTQGTSNADSFAKGKYLYKDASGYSMFDFDFTYTAAGWSSQFNSAGVYEAVLNDMWSDNHAAMFVELGDEAKDFSEMRFFVSGNEWHTKVLGWTETASVDSVVIPQDKQFIAGTMFDASGITVNYTRTDGEKGSTGDNLQFFNKELRLPMSSEECRLAEGEVVVRVLFDSVVYDFTITVVAPSVSSISLDCSEVQKVFAAGAQLETAGLKLTAEYNNGTASVITEGFEVSAPDMSAAGTAAVTVTYAGKTAEYQIAVVPASPVATVEFASAESGASLTLYITEREGGVVAGKYLVAEASGLAMNDFAYAAGEFTAEGLEVERNADVWSESYNAVFADSDGAEVKRFSLSGAAWQYNVLGINAVQAIESVDTAANEYIEGGEFNAEGIVINYSLTDGSTDSLTVSAENIADGTVRFYTVRDRADMTAEGYTLPIEGQYNVLAVYGGVAFGFTLTVKDNPDADFATLTAITADASAAKTVYVHGEQFSADGLVVKAQYSDGSETALAEGEYTLSEVITDELEGTAEVTVSYNGMQTTYQITVSHAYASSVYDAAEGKFYRECPCGSRTEVAVDANTSVKVNGKDFTAYAAYGEEAEGYGITYDVALSEQGVFVITLNAENTAGVYAEGLSVETGASTTAVIINVTEGAAAVNITVNAGWAKHTTINVAPNAQTGNIEFISAQPYIIVADIYAGTNSHIALINMAIFNGVNLTLEEGAYVGSYTTVDDSHETITLNGNATIGNINVNGSNGSTTILGEGKLTVENGVVAQKGDFVVLTDMDIFGTVEAVKFTVGNEEGTVRPVINVSVDNNFGFKNVDSWGFVSMTLRFFSGDITYTNTNANAGFAAINMNAATDNVYIGKNATFTAVNCGPVYTIWGGSVNTYKVVVYGKLIGVGDGEVIGDFIEAGSETEVGTFVAEGGLHSTNGHVIDRTAPSVSPEEGAEGGEGGAEAAE